MLITVSVLEVELKKCSKEVQILQEWQFTAA